MVYDVFDYSPFAGKYNKRDQPNLGQVSLQGLTAYPVLDTKMNVTSTYPSSKYGWVEPKRHNIEAFRNIDSGAKHLSPGMNRFTGDLKLDTGILSVQRKTPDLKTVAVANALPIKNPFVRLNQKKQMRAYLGIPEKNKKANRTAHLWTAGDLSNDELKALIEGKQTPMEILGMDPNIVLDRNQAGDATVFYDFDGELFEMPRIGYSVYDIKDHTMPSNVKWKRENRIMRDDVPPPFREARGHMVSGSVDPLLQIPLHWAEEENPSLRTRPDQRYIEWRNPNNPKYLYEGLPLPLSLTGDYNKPFVESGIATGTHGLYFDDAMLTNAGKEVWDAAMTGDIVRRALETIFIRDGSTIQKMPHPEARRIQPGKPMPTPIKLQGAKNKPMYDHIMQALAKVLPNRTQVEPFAGAGGLSFSYGADKSILNDINPDTGNFMRRIIREPFQIDSDAYNYKVGDDIVFPHPQLGEEFNIGEYTQEIADQYGGNTWIPAKYYEIRDEYNALREKARDGMATKLDLDRMSELLYILQLTGYNGLVRYGKTRELPSWENPWSTSAGVTRAKDKLPINQELESNFFDEMKARGFYDEESDRYKGRLQPGGNVARPTPYRGGGGMHDFAPWHDKMKNWDWRTGDAIPFLESMLGEMNPDEHLLTVDPPYFQEEGAHQFFGIDEQNALLEQLKRAKEMGLPTVVFNSMDPSIVDPLREAGFDINTLDRMDLISPNQESRGLRGELLAMANIDRDAFMQAWQDAQMGGQGKLPL